LSTVKILTFTNILTEQQWTPRSPCRW